jgi:hypothetical protein
VITLISLGSFSRVQLIFVGIGFLVSVAYYRVDGARSSGLGAGARRR